MTSQEDLADPSYSVYHVSPSIPTPHASAEVPALAFGLYKVPNGDEGVRIISDAILRAGYRHLDSASIYGNEKTLGRALSECCGTTKEKISAGTSQSKTVKRSDLFIASKVWNDAQREGRPAVRRSVEQSLDDLGLEYLDVCYIHWPVPNNFVGAYRELMLLQKEGKIRFLGISNFRTADFNELQAKIPQDEFVPPLIHQFEVSPFMYRPETIEYFTERKIVVAASKALNRTVGLDSNDGAVVKVIAKSHSVTPAQILLRWSFQKGFVVLSKTISLLRMKENRALFDFSLSTEEMNRLDEITKEEIVRARDELEAKRRTS
jgi:diketogulonate reductase-like aldo/keto reductase